MGLYGFSQIGKRVFVSAFLWLKIGNKRLRKMQLRTGNGALPVRQSAHRPRSNFANTYSAIPKQATATKITSMYLMIHTSIPVSQNQASEALSKTLTAQWLYAGIARLLPAPESDRTQRTSGRLQVDSGLANGRYNPAAWGSLDSRPCGLPQ
jgi:hypothetical protein